MGIIIFILFIVGLLGFCIPLFCEITRDILGKKKK